MNFFALHYLILSVSYVIWPSLSHLRVFVFLFRYFPFLPISLQHENRYSHSHHLSPLSFSLSLTHTRAYLASLTHPRILTLMTQKATSTLYSSHSQFKFDQNRLKTKLLSSLVTEFILLIDLKSTVTIRNSTTKFHFDLFLSNLSFLVFSPFPSIYYIFLSFFPFQFIPLFFSFHFSFFH